MLERETDKEVPETIVILAEVFIWRAKQNVGLVIVIINNNIVEWLLIV